MKTILKVRLNIMHLIAIVFVLPNQIHGQDRLFEPLLIDSRIYSIRDNNHSQMYFSGVGITYRHEIKEKIYKRKVLYNLLVPFQYVTNSSTGENKLDAYSIGSVFRMDIATLHEDSKWFFTQGLGMEFYLMNKPDLRFNTGAVLFQVGLRYRNSDALFQDLEFGLTSSLFIYNKTWLDFAGFAGFYVRLGIF